jgi:hypothetical protein
MQKQTNHHEKKSMKISNSAVQLDTSLKDKVDVIRENIKLSGTATSSQLSFGKICKKKKKGKTIPFLSQTPIKIRPHSSNQKLNCSSKSLFKNKTQKQIFGHIPKPKQARNKMLKSGTGFFGIKNNVLQQDCSYLQNKEFKYGSYLKIELMIHQSLRNI